MRVILLLLMSCLTLLSAYAVDAAIYQDSTFQMTNWPQGQSITQQDNGNAGSSFTQATDSGTTAPCGRLTGYANAYASSRGGYATNYTMWAFSGAEYNPATAPITSIRWGAACQTTSYTHSGDGYGSVTWCLAVSQNGYAYKSTSYGPDNSSWADFDKSVPCSASDFSWIMSDGMHPNFSATGAPLKFGIMVISNAVAGDPYWDPNPSHSVSRTIEVDDWWVSVNSVPEPSSFLTLFFGVGMSGVIWRRRR